MRELGCQIKFRGKTRIGNESGHEIELQLYPQDRRTEKKFGTNLDLTWILAEKKLLCQTLVHQGLSSGRMGRHILGYWAHDIGIFWKILLLSFFKS